MEITISMWMVPTGKDNSPDTIGPSYSKDVTYTGEVMGNYVNGSVSNSYGWKFLSEHAIRYIMFYNKSRRCI